MKHVHPGLNVGWLCVSIEISHLQRQWTWLEWEMEARDKLLVIYKWAEVMSHSRIMTLRRLKRN